MTAGLRLPQSLSPAVRATVPFLLELLFLVGLHPSATAAAIPSDPPGSRGDYAEVAAESAAAEAYMPPESFINPGPNRRVELISRGLKGLLPARLDIPDPETVERVYIEVVYKGKLPGTDLHGAIEARLQERQDITLTPHLIDGNWGSEGAAVFYGEVGPTDRVLLDFEVEERSAQSLLVYVLRRATDPGYQGGAYASFFGHRVTKSFEILVPRDTRVRDIHVTIPVTEITTDGRVLDFVISAGDKQKGFRREWNPGHKFDNECCIDTIQATLHGVTGDFDHVRIQVNSPRDGSGQSFIVSGIVQTIVTPTCAPLEVELPTGTCTNNSVSFSAASPGPGYEVTWDFGAGAEPRTAVGFGKRYVMFPDGGRRTVTATLKGPDCGSTESYAIDVDDCDRSTCALEAARVIQHPAHGNRDGIIELDLCISCGSTPPYTIDYRLGGQRTRVEHVDQVRPRLTGLAAGTYDQIYVTDANGCQTNVTGPITLCDGGCDGRATCPLQTCTLTGVNDNGGKRAFWIPDLVADAQRWRWADGTGALTVTGESTARVTGRIVSTADANCGFEVDLRLRARRNWSQWSALGRDWKGSDTHAPGNEYTRWDYYELEPGASTLEGTGCFSGTLTLTPKPADYRYGVQVGKGANDLNGSPGISGWFRYEGTLNGERVEGEGDINAEGTCRIQDLSRSAVPIITCAPDYDIDCGASLEVAPKPTINCGNPDDYGLTYTDRELSGQPRRIERTWTATGAGGPATCVQVLTFGDDQPPVFTRVPESGRATCGAVAEQVAEATDACGEVEVTFAETRFNERCEGRYDLRRVWTATDESGNTATAEAIIQVVDEEGPTFQAPPADVVLECKDPLPTDAPTAYDNCGARVSIDYETVACRAATPIYIWQDGELVYLTERSNPGLTYAAGMKALELVGVCSDDPLQRKRWRLDNPNDYPVYVERVEAYAKTVYGGFVLPAGARAYFFTAQLPGANAAEIVYRDGGDAERRVAATANDQRCELSPAETCTCVELRRWTAEDPCGNRTVYEQKVWRRDTKAPVIRDIPADRAYGSREDIPQAPAARATDACASAVVTVTEFTFPSTDADCETAAAYSLFGAKSAGLPVLSLGGRDFAIGEAPLQLRTKCDGTAELTGSVVDVADLTAGFAVRLQLDTRRTYDEHHGAGGTALAACDEPRRTDWLFYRLAVNSTLTGEGALAGTTVTLTPNPTTVLQLGPGANRVDCKLGAALDFGYEVSAGAFPGDSGALRTAYVEASLASPGACADNVTVVRVYDAQDECGNRAVERQVIRVRDRQRPRLVGVPSDITYDCSAAIPDAEVGAEDDSEATVELEEVATGTDCDRTIVRTWTATDACGNTATASQTIRVTDERAPIIALSSPELAGRSNGDLLRVSCSQVPTLDATVATVSDNCSAAPELHFESAEEAQGDCAANGFSQRIRCTWTATDGCGNVTAFVLFVEFVDDRAPVFADVPEATSIACGEGFPSTEPGVTDNCTDQVAVEYAERRGNGACANSYSILRVWTATDDCGNVSTAEQTVTVVDAVAPAFAEVPSSTSISCAEAFPTTAPRVTDACDGDVSLVESQSRTDGACAASYTVIRTWTATDNCGNTATVSQTVTVADDEAPAVSFVNDRLRGFADGQELVVSCGDVPTFSAEDLVASDDCDRSAAVAYTQSATPLGACDGDGFVQTITARWTATDACGNATNVTVYLKVKDDIGPRVTNVPGDVHIACGTPLPTAQPTIDDNCTSSAELLMDETTTREEGTCADVYRVVREWTVTDACGNATTASQVISVADERRPTLANVPESVTIGCEEALPTDLPTATDDCDAEVVISFEDSRRAGACAAGASITRLFTATDNCGNTAIASQVITVRDRSAPVLADVPADLTVSCAEGLPSPTGEGAPVASDNCDTDVAVEHSDRHVAGACPDAYQVVRTWTATDDCGNTATASQTITVEDSETPVFVNLPEAITVSCDAALPSTSPAASDNCDADVNVAVTQNRRPGDCDNAYVLVRLFTATDNCGNTTTAVQEVTVEDAREPTFANLPADLTIGCTEALPQNRPNASDNCDGTVAVVERQRTVTGECPGSYTVLRTFTAVDGCGNEAVATQTVTVRDRDAPVFSYVPPALAIACAGDVPTEGVEVSDACDDGVVVKETQDQRAGACAGSYEIVRLWTATDHCGNVATASQVVSVTDETAPAFVGIPADITIACDVPLPTDAPTASDDCDAAPAVELSELRRPGDCPGDYELIRTWTARDHCGNTATARQIVRVRDREAPVLTDVPAPVTLSCEAGVPSTRPQATDGCDSEVVITEVTERRPGACADSYVLVRTWTATDHCGNTATASQAVTFEDLSPPVFAAIPTAVTISCTEAVPMAQPAVSDNCDGDVAINLVQTREDGDCSDGYRLVRQWTATDNCGNVTTASQVVSVEDVSPPVFAFVPEAMAIACNGALPTAQPEVNDDCDRNVTLVESQETRAGDCPGSYLVVRSWTATDNCGNAATASQAVTVRDTEGPTFAGVPSDVTLACDAPAPTAQPSVEDACDDAPTVVESSETTLGDCPGAYLLTRLWTATDACGNTATATQTVTFADETAPTFTEVPTAVTLSCEDEVPTVLAKATDACDDNVAVTVEDTRRPGTCPGAFDVVRTFKATDACGNVATASQVVSFRDEVAPVLVGVPPAITIECDGVLPQNEPTATDNCDVNVVITQRQETLPGACEDNRRILRVWTATDACGNTATASQVVTLEDTTAPTFTSIPEGTTIECSGELPKTHAVATDNCDREVAVTVASFREGGDCTDAYSVVRVFTATDNCGNTATATQRVDVRDRTAPTFLSVPRDVTVSCDEALPISLASATDNCDQQVTVTAIDARVDGECPDAYQVVRTFTATDDCGNTATITQTVTVRDGVSPTFSGVPAGVDIACDAPVPTDAPVATDNCDRQVSVVETQTTEPGRCGGTSAILRTWTATDDCGNTATATQRVRRTDTEAPRFSSVPSDLTIACDAELPVDLPTVTDACDEAVTVTEAQTTEPGECAGSYTVTRVFTASDDCGNSATARQVVTVEDRGHPTLTAIPTAVTISCDAAVPTGLPTASDDCDMDVNVAADQEFLRSGCAGNYRIVRTFTATDDCGNATTATQLVTVQDLIAPVFAQVPPAVVIGCDEVAPTSLPVASDNCDASVAVSETQSRLPGGCDDSYTLVRTFTAVDACGNLATAEQRVTISDGVAPVLSDVPAALALSCDEELPTDQPSARDNCDGEVVLTESRETTAGECAEGYVLIRTWTASDNCGNTATASQRIEVGDADAPTFTSVPQDITISCDAVVPTDRPIAADACSGDVDIVETSRREGGRCAEGYRVIREWTATDACGNVASATQVVTVEDEESPVFVSVPAAASIGCDRAIPTTQPRVTDNCDEEVSIEERTERDRGECKGAYRLTRIWIATDDCGNTALASQVVTVEDLTPPTFASVPASVTIACGEAMPDAEAVATDNCDEEVVVRDSEVREAGACEDGYAVVRTWTATDNCGNVATATQVITVIDARSPVLAGVPPAAAVTCSAGLPTSAPTATDDCDRDVDIAETTETLQGPCPDTYVVIRTWTATDNCGNTASASQEVTVSDDSGPVFSRVPASRTVDCDEDPGDDEPVAVDECDRDVAITMTETTKGEDCRSGITLIRTWTATDNCGNTATASQTIRFEDTQGPTISDLARSLSIECDQPVPTVYPTATDQCDRDVDLQFFDARDERECGATVTRTWVATDDCGNSVTATQIITVVDSSEPVLAGVPAATQITCEAPLPPASVTASDNCGTALPVQYEEVETEGRCPGERIIVRVWTATDACGNAAVGTQEVVVTDGSAPTLAEVPGPVELACGAALPTTLPTATDACGGAAPEVTFEDRDQAGACANSYRVVRTFTVTDDCGNATTASQVITFRDENPPVLSDVPADVTLSCGEVLPKGDPEARDDCDEAVDVSLEERTINGDCPQRYSVVRTWTATDDCGNATTASQVITVTDDGGPRIADFPKDIELACGESVPADEPTASDACDTGVEIFLAEERVEQGGGYVLTRVWTATDACGNTATARQTVTVAASGRPTFAFVPEDLTLACTATVPDAEALASDGCGGSVQVTRAEKRRDGKCVGSYTLTRTWTATAGSGKTARATQVITVTDDRAPVFTLVPQDRTLACGEALPTETAQAEDQCGGRVRVGVKDERDEGTCAASRTVTRVFTARDDCGNEATATQLITYRDEVAPEFTYVPNSEEYQCSVGVPRDRARASDDCSRRVEVTYVDVAPSTDCAQRLQRVWTATDECGNTATAVQQILLEDTERPTLNGVPGNTTVDVSGGRALPPPARVTASDGCDSAPAVELDEETVPGEGCNYVVVRTWTVVDRCGNSARGTQRISVTSEGEGEASIRIEGEGGCAVARVAVASATHLSGATYAWTASAGSFVDPSAAATEFLPEGRGTYEIQLVVSGNGCSGAATETIAIQQDALEVGAVGSVCPGETISLTASAGADSYRWTGPGGFASEDRNPSIPAATAAMGGTYRLTAVFGDCIQEADVRVNISGGDPARLEVPTEVCPGVEVRLTSDVAVTWTAPDGTTYEGAVVTVPVNGRAIGNWSVSTGLGACETTQAFSIAERANCGDGGGNPGGECRLPSTSALEVTGITCERSKGAITIPVDTPALYTYEWAPDVSGGPGANNLAAGEYTATVTRIDDTTCRQAYRASVSASVGFKVDATAEAADCDGLGGIMLVPSAPGDYTIRWTDLDVDTEDLTRGGLAAGDYGYRVSDAAGCTAEGTIRVANACACEARASIVRAEEAKVCLNGEATVAIVIVRPPSIPIGATARYVLVDRGSGRVVATNGTGEFAVATVGEYSIHQLIAGETDVPGDLLAPGADLDDLTAFLADQQELICAAFTNFGARFTVEICCTVPVIATITTTEADCARADGTATVLVDNPQAGDLYTWTPALGIDDPEVVGRRGGLPAGAYTVQVTRSGDEDCGSTATVVVGNTGVRPGQPAITAANCGAANGSVSFPTGAIPYRYVWEDGTEGGSRTGLAAGRYAVSVTSGAGGCAETIAVVVPGVVDFDAAATVLGAPTCGGSDGSVRIDVSGGSGDFTYDWGAGAQRNDLASGNYVVVVSDGARGCSDTVRFVLNDGVTAAATVTARDVALECATDRYGVADYDVAYAEGFVAPPTVTVVDVAGATARQGRLAPGRYSVLVRDGDGCLAGSRAFEVTAPERLHVEVAATPARCGAGGAIRLDVTGGRPPYRFDYEGIGGASDPSEFTDLAPGRYAARVADASGCLARLGDIVVEDACGNSNPRDTIVRREVRQGFAGEVCFDALQLSLGGTVVSVRDACDDSGGDARAELHSGIEGQCLTYTGIRPGTDSLCVVYCTAAACDTFGLVVTVIPPTIDSVERQLTVGQRAEFCLDLSEVSLPITEAFNYCRSESGEAVALDFDAERNCVSYTGLASGTELGCFVVCNGLVCDTTVLTVTVSEAFGEVPPIAVDDAGETTVGTPVVIDVLANDTLNGPLVQFSFTRLPDEGTLFQESEGVIRYTSSPGFCGRVDSFSYAISNGFGFDTAVARIQVTCDALVIPSGISPNGDGVNDAFRILGIETYPTNSLLVFNRWGNEVFETDNYDNSTDKVFTGRWNGKNLPEGTYFYVLDLEDGEEPRSGYLQIMR